MAQAEPAIPLQLRPPLSLLATVAALTLIRSLVAAYIGLTDDEAYYRLWALAPALSYLDHPPMVGWMIAAGRWIAGDNALGIRLAAVAASLIGVCAVWRCALILFGATLAERATWFVLAMPLLAVGSIIITPDTPSVLFWGLTGWAVAELHVSRNAHWWLAAGLFAGLGLLSKYTNLFAAAGIGLWLILLPANWRWFRTWQLWAGGALTILLAMPVVIWNANHGWASFSKQFGRVVEGKALTFRFLLELIGAYAGLASPLIAMLAVMGYCRVASAVTAQRDQARVLLAAGLLPLLAYILLHALHDRVQPNWTAPLYPSLAICAAIATGETWQWPRTWRLPTGSWRWATAVGLGLSGLLYGHAMVPLVRLADLKDPTAQMRGWSRLAAEVEQLRKASSACWIATSSYATTGQLAYALGASIPVVQLTERIRYVHLPPVADSLFACPGLYVELERRASRELLQARFQDVQSQGRLMRDDHGVTIAAYAAYRIARPIGPIFSD
jgi:4-amino-4-deoxy-L-arabinose transferase-like glycosyltransferase